jgi:hypothetical protein
VEASSVFDAAAQATHGWAKLWWYAPDAVIEVCAGEEVWRVRAETGAPVDNRKMWDQSERLTASPHDPVITL